MDEDIDTGKDFHLTLHGPDREIINKIKKRHGGSTASAIRSCIRIADEVILKLVHSPTKSE